MLKNSLLGAGLLLGIWLTPAASLKTADPARQAEEPIRVRAGLYENPPKLYTDDNGQPAGFWADLLGYLAEQEGWEIVWVPGTWEEGLARLQAGSLDLLPDVIWTEPRAQALVFSSETVLLSWSRLYVPQGSRIESILDLEGKTIAALAGSANLDGPEGLRELTEEFALDCTFLEMPSYHHVFQAIESGEVDAGITNKDFGNAHEADYAVERTPILFQPAHLSFAFPRHGRLTPFLRERIDAQLRALKADQSSYYYLALENHLEEAPSVIWIETLPGWTLAVLGIGSGALLFLLALGAATRFQVQRRTRELQVAQDRFSSMLQSMDDLVFVFDESNRFVLTNASDDRLLRPASEFRGRTHGEVMSPEVDERFIEALPGLRQGRSASYDYELEMPDGRHWYAARLSPLMHAGKYEGVVAVIRDISDRKREEQQRANRQRLLLALSQAAQSAQQARSAEEVFQAIGEQVAPLGLDAMVLSLSDDRRQFIVSYLTLASSLLQEGEALSALATDSHRFDIPEGGVFAGLLASGVARFITEEDPLIAEGFPPPVRPLAGRLLKMLGWRQAVLAPLKLEDEVRAILMIGGAQLSELDLPAISAFANQAAIAITNARLYRETRRLAAFNQGLIESMAEGLVVENAAGVVVFCNPAAGELLGYAAEELQGRHWTELMPPDQHPLVRAANQRRLEGGSDQYEVDLLHKNGERISVLVSGSPLRIEEGEPAGTLAVFTDIRQRKQAASELQRYSEKLQEMVEERTRELQAAQEQIIRQERLALLGELAGSVSHELRNPLTTIANSVYYLKHSHSELGAEVLEYFNLIQSEVAAANKIIADLLDYARSVPGERVITSVRKLIEEALVSQPIPEDVQLMLAIDRELPAIRIDRQQIQQVLGNLITNALQAMPEGGELRIRGGAEGRQILIAVQDSGVGIAEADLPKLFEPLFSTKTHGIGLGLASSKRYAEANQGSITVSSAPGAGSTFTLRLPAYRGGKV